jgi:hypothetical protein
VQRKNHTMSHMGVDRDRLQIADLERRHLAPVFKVDGSVSSREPSGLASPKRMVSEIDDLAFE